MNLKQIYRELKNKQVFYSSFFGRKLVVVRKADFENYKKYFQDSYNALNKYKNYRTNSIFRHVHAIDFGEYVQIHLDYANVSKSFLLAIPHFIFDMLPYFSSCLLKRKRPYTLKW